MRAADSGCPAPLLLVRSSYSLLRGSSLPASLAAAAAEGGYRAIALVDRTNLYAAVPFLEAAEACGMRGILGTELELPLAVCGAGRAALAGEARSDPREAARRARLFILCREMRGYRNLSALLTRLHLEGESAAGEALTRAHAGLTLLSDDAALLRVLAASVSAADLGALLLRPQASPRQEAALLALGAQCGIAVIAGGFVSMVSPHERETQRLLATIRAHGLLGIEDSRAHTGHGGRSGCRDSALQRAGTPPGVHEGATLASAQETARRFADLEPALRAAQACIGRCLLSLPELAPPRFLLPSVHGRDGPAILRRLCAEGLSARGLAQSSAARRRLETELGLIETLGFIDYFLIVAEIVGWARRRGIRTVGRGSGASSIVAYLIGVTNVDPIQYQLCFERFLHPLRRDLPDLDIDIAWDRRDEVLAFALERFGKERAGMIGTHQFFRARGAFREAARALGLAEDLTREGARHLPHSFFGDREAAAERAALGELARHREPSLRRAARAAVRLLGLPRNLGLHPGGIVFADGALGRCVPLERSANGITVTQFEMRAIEKIGLVKIDLLGNRALGMLAEGGRGIDLAAIPHADAATAQLLAQGRTLGCFQIESPAMRTLLRQLRSADLDGLIAAVALIRPGPAGSGMKAAFIRRANGSEPASVLHPALEGCLRATHGLPLYEEDVIQIAATLAGTSLAEADLLRRAVGAAAQRAKSGAAGAQAALGQVERGFLAAARGNGIAQGVAAAAWGELVRFTAYSFCKAHAAGYGCIAYEAAWLKAHHPGPFFAAVLNHHRGMYPTRVYVDEARRHGLRLLPPCVARSARGWIWQAGAGAGAGSLRCGLAAIRGLRQETIAAILAQRGAGLFRDLADLAARTATTAPELEALVLSGACDEVFGVMRGELLWQLQRWFRHRARRGVAARECGERQQVLALATGAQRGGVGECRGASDGPHAGRQVAHDRPGPLLRDLPRRRRAELERRFLGFSLAEHPIARWRDGPGRDACPVARVAERAGETVRVVGVVSASRRVHVQGTTILFITLEDETGLLECVVREHLFGRRLPRISIDSYLEAIGRAGVTHGAPGLDILGLHVLGEH